MSHNVSTPDVSALSTILRVKINQGPVFTVIELFTVILLSYYLTLASQTRRSIFNNVYRNNGPCHLRTGNTKM